MDIVSMKCPNCRALIYFEEDQQTCFCSHCGSQIKISDPNNKKITYTKIDAARIKEAETRESIRQRELDLEERRLNKEKYLLIIKAVLTGITIIAVAAVAIYFIYLLQSNEEFGYLIGALLMVGGFFALLITMIVHS